MKTLQQLFDEIKTSDALKKELTEALGSKDPAAVLTFLKKNDCGASLDEAKKFLAEKGTEQKSELSADELEQVAGGTSPEALIIGGAIIAGLDLIGIEIAVLASC